MGSEQLLSWDEAGAQVSLGESLSMWAAQPLIISGLQSGPQADQHIDSGTASSGVSHRAQTLVEVSHMLPVLSGLGCQSLSHPRDTSSQAAL